MQTTDMTVPPQKPKGVKRQKLRQWVLRLTLLLAILAPLTFVIAAVGYKLGLFGLGTSFGLLNLKVGPLMLGLSLMMGIFSLLLAFLIQPRKGFVVAILAMLIPIFGFGKLAGTKAKVDELPFIHDVTTDTQNPPMFTAAIMDQRNQVKGVNSADYIGKKDSRDNKLVAALQTKAYPDIRTVVMNDDPQVIFGKAEAIAKQMGWAIANANSDTGLIEATDTTFWYGFQDDVIIRIKPSEGGGTVVDVRSLSRVGGSDLGKNADRIRDFIERLEAA